MVSPLLVLVLLVAQARSEYLLSGESSYSGNSYSFVVSSSTCGGELEDSKFSFTRTTSGVSCNSLADQQHACVVNFDSTGDVQITYDDSNTLDVSFDAPIELGVSSMASIANGRDSTEFILNTNEASSILSTSGISVTDSADKNFKVASIGRISDTQFRVTLDSAATDGSSLSVSVSEGVFMTKYGGTPNGASSFSTTVTTGALDDTPKTAEPTPLPTPQPTRQPTPAPVDVPDEPADNCNYQCSGYSSCPERSVTRFDIRTGYSSASKQTRTCTSSTCATKTEERECDAGINTRNTKSMPGAGESADMCVKQADSAGNRCSTKDGFDTSVGCSCKDECVGMGNCCQSYFLNGCHGDGPHALQFTGSFPMQCEKKDCFSPNPIIQDGTTYFCYCDYQCNMEGTCCGGSAHRNSVC